VGGRHIQGAAAKAGNGWEVTSKGKGTGQQSKGTGQDDGARNNPMQARERHRRAYKQVKQRVKRLCK
jgi:hypothetical protein